MVGLAFSIWGVHVALVDRSLAFSPTVSSSLIFWGSVIMLMAGLAFLIFTFMLFVFFITNPKQINSTTKEILRVNSTLKKIDKHLGEKLR
jgi:hypothetical protein